jgi:hypothetical protein
MRGLSCTHCGQSKPETDFPANPRKQNGLSSWCRDCHNESSRRSHERAWERDAPIREAERRKAHAEFMERLAELRRNRLKQVARNRKALERRKQPT